MTTEARNLICTWFDFDDENAEQLAELGQVLRPKFDNILEDLNRKSVV